MTTTDVDADADAKHLHCGCCGRTMPADRLTELGSTPGVSICSGCALWAARRPSRLPDLRRVTRALADGIARIRPGRGRAGASGRPPRSCPAPTSTAPFCSGGSSLA